MVGSISTKEIDVLVNNLDRPQLLTILRVEDMTGQVGDDECVHPIAVSTVERFTVHKNMCLSCKNLTPINAPEQSYVALGSHRLTFHVSLKTLKVIDFGRYATRYGWNMTKTDSI